MADLVKYDAACRAVAEAASIDEAKEFRDQSEAMRAYARQAKNKDLEVQAAEIRIRAERRIGELMAAQRDGGHMAPAGRPSEEIGSRTNPISKPPTLAEVGIDKKLADRARKYAAIPEQEFNGIVSDWREKVEAENQRVTVNLLDAGAKAEAQKPAHEAAPDPYGYSKLTDNALLDLANGLRADLDDEKAAHGKTKAKLKEVSENLKNRTADDKDEVIRRLEAEAKNARNAKWKALEDRDAYHRQAHALKKRIAEIEKVGVAY